MRTDARAVKSAADDAEETTGCGRGRAEIMLLKELHHENIIKLLDVHVHHQSSSLYLVFSYAEHDLYEIIRCASCRSCLRPSHSSLALTCFGLHPSSYHREKLMGKPIDLYTVKSLLWQLLHGLNYLHKNWIFHRDLKPRYGGPPVMRRCEAAGGRL